MYAFSHILPSRGFQWLSMAGCCGVYLLFFSTWVLADPPIQIDPVLIEDKSSEGEKDQSSFVEIARPEAGDGVESLDGFLKRFPGLQLRGEGGWGREVGVSLRGTDNQQTLLFLDNIPLNTAVGGGVDLSLFQVGDLEKVEVYRGGSALFGANALGGALRMVSRTPGEEPEGNLTAKLGSFGTFALTGNGGRRWGDFTLSLSGGLERSEGNFLFVDSNGRERTRDNNHRRSYTTSARLTYGFNGGSHLALTERFVFLERGAPGVEQFPTAFAHLEEWRNITGVEVQMPSLFGSDFFLSATAWHQIREFLYQDPEPYLPPAISTEIHEQVVGGYLETGWIGNSWFSIRGRLEPTVEWAEIKRTDSVQHPSRARLGAVLAADFQKPDGSLMVTGVLRGDVDLEGGFNGVWKVGLLGLPHENVTLRMNVGRAYRPPSFEELYYDAGAIRGNPDLNAEDALSMDGGVEIRWNDMELKLGGFWLEIDNLILFLPKTSFLMEADDSRGARSQGLETSLGWDMSSWMRLDASYTFVHAVFKDTGNALPARSPHLFRLRGEAHWKPFSIHLQSDWQSGFFVDRFENLSEESRWWVSGGLRVRPNSWLQLSLDGHNLLNKKDAVDGLQFPLPGRSFFMRLTMAN